MPFALKEQAFFPRSNSSNPPQRPAQPTADAPSRDVRRFVDLRTLFFVLRRHPDPERSRMGKDPCISSLLLFCRVPGAPFMRSYRMSGHSRYARTAFPPPATNSKPITYKNTPQKPQQIPMSSPIPTQPQQNKQHPHCKRVIFRPLQLN
jgi:hypothetical protein